VEKRAHRWMSPYAGGGACAPVEPTHQWRSSHAGGATRRWRSPLTSVGARTPVEKPAHRCRSLLADGGVHQWRSRLSMVLGDGDGTTCRWSSVPRRRQMGHRHQAPLEWGRGPDVERKGWGGGAALWWRWMDSSTQDFWIWNRTGALGFGSGVGVWVYMAPRPPGRRVWYRFRGTWSAGLELGATKLCWSGCVQQQ
jgi:hypothetical protein